jgi:hypothetical protein
MARPVDPSYGWEIPDFPTDPGYDIPQDFLDRLRAIYVAMVAALAMVIEEIRNRPRPDNSLPGEEADTIAERLEAVIAAIQERIDQMPQPDNTLPGEGATAEPKS